MKIVISTDSSNTIFTAPIERILGSVAYKAFDLSKYRWIHYTKGKLADCFKEFCLDDFKRVIECVTLNQSGVEYTIEPCEDDERDDYNVADVFNCTYDELFNSLCDVISSYTSHGFSRSEENFKVAIEYFIMQITFGIQGYQYMDVYKYYKSLGCNEAEFLDMLSEGLKSRAIDSIQFLKDYYDDFNIKDPSYMDELLDNMSIQSDDVINQLRECAK